VTRTAYTGDVWMPVMTNALINTIMYVYFLLTCFGVKPTWDRTLTLMQLVQFCIMITQGALNLAYGCAYPTVVSLFYVLYITFMLGLFTHFYILKYHRTKKPRGDAAFVPNKKAQ
jgi:predicted neutral ceramidase superfamily lipid hydrolase